MINAKFARNAEPEGKEKLPTVVGVRVLWMMENEAGGAILRTSEIVALNKRRDVFIKKSVLSSHLNERKPGHV